MATARLFPTLLLFSAHCGKNGDFAAWLPAAQAFSSTVLRKESSLSKFHREATTARPHRSRSRPPRRRQLLLQPPAEAPIALRMRKSLSEDDSVDASAVVDNVKRLFLPLTAFVVLSLATIAAYTDHLPGPLIDATAPPPFFSTLPYGVFFSGSFGSYTPTLIVRDVRSTVLCIAGAAAFVKGITYPSSMGYIEPRDARKIIHTCSAPLFLLLWPLFSNAYGARVFASIVPLLNALRLFVAGTGSSSDNGGESSRGSETELAGAISRSGDAKEALGGPFIYVIVMFISTLFFWTDSPVGVVSMATMALGDGLADLIGRRFGSSNKWLFNKSKSMAGSAAFVAGSFVGSYGLILWLTSMGAMDPLSLDTVGLLGRLLVIAVFCAGVELIPVGDDNWSVPSSAALLSAFLLN